MKSPLLMAAIGLLLVSNAWVLTNVARNQSSEPDSEIQLTARELPKNFTSSDDSMMTLRLAYQDLAPQYRPGPAPEPSWFDRKKLAELGLDTSVAPDAPNASQHYSNARSREVYVALEYDGPGWQKWLMQRETQLLRETQYNPQMSPAQQLEIDRQTATRLAIVDAAPDPASLRAKYPNRKQVMIMRGLARVVLDYPPSLRGAITQISTAAINVPASLRSRLGSESYYSPYNYDGKELNINAPSYTVTLRVGSRHEPWIADVKSFP